MVSVWHEAFCTDIVRHNIYVLPLAHAWCLIPNAKCEVVLWLKYETISCKAHEPFTCHICPQVFFSWAMKKEGFPKQNASLGECVNEGSQSAYVPIPTHDIYDICIYIYMFVCVCGYLSSFSACLQYVLCDVNQNHSSNEPYIWNSSIIYLDKILSAQGTPRTIVLCSIFDVIAMVFSASGKPDNRLHQITRWLYSALLVELKIE